MEELQPLVPRLEQHIVDFDEVAAVGEGGGLGLTREGAAEAARETLEDRGLLFLDAH